ncbi:MAG TPA: ABC transporter permease [Terracidiphilus sp.]|nr:ABC transporter permease [Terracidiphilus sp.]
MGLHSFAGRMLAQMRSWLRAAMRRGRLESEMEAELAHHLECVTADLVRSGLPPGEAERRARIALGSSIVHKEGMRTSLGLRWWDQLRSDLRYGIRLLRKSPGFTAVAATSLALVIGANTTIFSIAKQLLYDRLAVPHPEQLRLLHWVGDKNVVVSHMWGDWDKSDDGILSTSFSYPAFEQLRRDNGLLEDLFAFKNIGRLDATINGEAQVLQGEMVSGNYFAALGVRPMRGRAIEPSDDRDGAAPVGLISAAFWQRAYGSSENIIGRTIKVNMTPVTIVGVTPRGFTGAKDVQSAPDIFLPFSVQPVVMPRFGGSLIHDANARMWWLNIMGRAKPGVSAAQAEPALSVSLAAVTRATLHPAATETMPRVRLGDGSRGLFFTERMFAKPLYVLLAVVGFVLLLACANIASLLLARSTARQREISVRLALGAGRGRVMRQVLTECLLLSTFGGALGLVVAFAGRNLIPGLLSNPWEFAHTNIDFDWRIFLFTSMVTLAAGFLFGMAPAIAAARNEVNSGLKETAQTTTRRRRGFSGKIVVGFQLTLSTILVVGAVLFARTLWNLSQIKPGFNVDQLVLFAVEQPQARYPTPTEISLHQRLQEKLRAIPGVGSVTMSEVPYISNSMEDEDFLPEGEQSDPHKQRTAYTNVVGESFFETMGIPIVAGRGFNAEDTRTSTHVAVISEKLARKVFPGMNPIGKRFMTRSEPKAGNPGELLQIVGVCTDTYYSNLREDPPGVFYLPFSQAENLAYGMTYEVRTRVPLESLAPAFRSALRSIDPDLPIVDLRTQREQIDATMQQERIFAALTAGFGVLALTLACVGIYGTMAYSVTQRTNEIGIRLALGAKPQQVLAMVLREASWLAVAGIAAGLVAALLLARLVKSMLFGLQPADPASLAGGAVLLAAVALAASWIPARTAT